MEIQFSLRKAGPARMDKSKQYIVLLVNPVQYQASCHIQLQREGLKCCRKLTAKVFRVLFGIRGHNLREDFKERITRYAPDVIVNCTTSSVKGVVKTAIKEAGYKESLKDCHPSWW